jgi:hypothetical protein
MEVKDPILYRIRSDKHWFVVISKQIGLALEKDIERLEKRVFIKIESEIDAIFNLEVKLSI